MDNGLAGSIIGTLSIDEMISTPLQAMIVAQALTAKSYADFLLQVCTQNGKTVAVQFDYDETIIDEKGVAQGTVRKTVRIPLPYAVVYPVIAIEEDTIDFELEVTQPEKLSSTTETEGSFRTKFGWGPFSVSVSGRASHKSEQTRGTDAHARYSSHTQVKRQSPPEALVRVTEFLTDTATKPMVVKDKENDVKPPPATPTDGTMVSEKVPAGGNAPTPAPVTP